MTDAPPLRGIGVRHAPTMSSPTRPDLQIRLARADDDDFIIGLADRFAEFDLPTWRTRKEVVTALRDDLIRTTGNLPAGSHLFVAEDADYQRVGFVHLMTVKDAFSDATNCHVSDLACAVGADGRGVGAALLAHAEDWAKRHRCRHVSLAVFPGNARAVALYERMGYGVEVQRRVKKLD